MQTFFWNPWPIFNELARSVSATSSPEWPKFDIQDTDDEVILTADLPGMSEDDLEITLAGQDLIVRGERKAKDGHYLHRGRFHGAFTRTFRLGDTCDPDRINAHIANGELTLRLGKTAKAKPRRIKLTSGIAGMFKGLLSGDKEKAQAA